MESFAGKFVIGHNCSLPSQAWPSPGGVCHLGVWHHCPSSCWHYTCGGHLGISLSFPTRFHWFYLPDGYLSSTVSLHLYCSCPVSRMYVLPTHLPFSVLTHTHVQALSYSSLKPLALAKNRYRILSELMGELGLSAWPSDWVGILFSELTCIPGRMPCVVINRLRVSPSSYVVSLLRPRTMLSASLFP